MRTFPGTIEVEALKHSDEPLASLEYNLKAAVLCIEHDDRMYLLYVSVAAEIASEITAELLKDK